MKQMIVSLAVVLAGNFSPAVYPMQEMDILAQNDLPKGWNLISVASYYDHDFNEAYIQHIPYCLCLIYQCKEFIDRVKELKIVINATNVSVFVVNWNGVLGVGQETVRPVTVMDVTSGKGLPCFFRCQLSRAHTLELFLRRYYGVYLVGVEKDFSIEHHWNVACKSEAVAFGNGWTYIDRYAKQLNVEIQPPFVRLVDALNDVQLHLSRVGSSES